MGIEIQLDGNLLAKHPVAVSQVENETGPACWTGWASARLEVKFTRSVGVHTFIQYIYHRPTTEAKPNGGHRRVRGIESKQLCQTTIRKKKLKYDGEFNFQGAMESALLEGVSRGMICDRDKAKVNKSTCALDVVGHTHTYLSLLQVDTEQSHIGQCSISYIQ